MDLLILDLGGSKMRWARSSENRMYILTEHPTPRDAKSICARIVDDFKAFDRTCVEQGLAISTTGQVDNAGAIVGSTKIFAGWQGFPLRERLEESLRVPVAVINDGNAFAFGEWQHRSQKESLLNIVIGTGIGAGYVSSEGAILEGREGRALELGHSLFAFDGRECLCGRRGCAEAYLSGYALARRGAGILGDSLQNYRQLVTLSREHPHQLDTFWDQVGTELAMALLSWDLIFAPHAIVFNGGVFQGHVPFWDSFLQVVKTIGRPDPTLVSISTLSSQAPLLGASALWQLQYG